MCLCLFELCHICIGDPGVQKKASDPLDMAKRNVVLGTKPRSLQEQRAVVSAQLPLQAPLSCFLEAGFHVAYGGLLYSEGQS